MAVDRIGARDAFRGTSPLAPTTHPVRCTLPGMRFLKFKHAIHDAYEFASVVFAQEFKHMHETLVMQAAAFFF